MDTGNANREPLYYISVAARLVCVHPQTLRMYERIGLIEPERTPNNVRLYSDADIERLRRIQRLTQELGVNLAGVEVILSLLDKIDQMQEEIERLQYELEHGPKQLPPPEQPRSASRGVRIEIGEG